MQDDILNRVRRTQVFAFPIGGTNKILLFFGEVRCAALIHLAATLRTIEQPGEDTHIAHFSWATAGTAYVLNNKEYAFLNNGRLCVLKDHPLRRVIPQRLFAFVGLLAGLEVYRMPLIFRSF